MEVFIYAPDGRIDPVERHIEYPRTFCSDAIQDAAQLAISELCRRHKEELRQSPFCFFPTTRAGQTHPELFQLVVDDPRLSHQVQHTLAASSTYARAQQEIGLLRRLLTSSYDHSDTLRAQLLQSEAAHADAVQARTAAEAEVERLRAATTTPTPPAPVAAPVQFTGPRTRLTARKSVRRSSPPPDVDIGGSSRGRQLSRSGFSDFSQSRSRSRSPNNCRGCGQRHSSDSEEDPEEDPEERIIVEDE